MLVVGWPGSRPTSFTLKSGSGRSPHTPTPPQSPTGTISASNRCAVRPRPGASRPGARGRASQRDALRSGRDAGRSACWFTASDRLTIRSVSFKAANGNGDGIEILSDGQAVRRARRALGTGQPYRWIDDSNPLEDTPLSAPLVGQEQVDAFWRGQEIMPLTRRLGAQAMAVTLHATSTPMD